jgi:3-hydroxypropanoate dehydrogenase
MENLTPEMFALLFDTKRTPRAWKNRSVDLGLLQKIYDHSKFGPTSANCSPLRVVFVQSKEAKEKLKPCLDLGNVDQTMKAPITAIFAYDLDFYTHMDRLYPHTNARAWFEGNTPLIKETAFRNATLQAAYFMICARGFGLDCGPMSGFKAAPLDEAFFKGTNYKSNFLCNLGYGDISTLKPRDWRFPFEEICTIV